MGKTVYVIGAGASREGGVPLTKEVLQVGLQLCSDLSKRLSEKAIEINEFLKKGESAMKFVTADQCDFLDFLTNRHLNTIKKVYGFLRDVLNWDGTTATFPDIEELWGILEIGSTTHANFEYAANERQTTCSELKQALTLLINYVLLGCKVSLDGNNVSYEYNRSDYYKNFVKKLPKERTIISLNYDTWIDNAIRELGFPIDYGSNFIPYQPEDVELAQDHKSETVLLLKPHGSFNWLYCPTCGQIEDFGFLHVSNIPIEQSPYREIDSDLPCLYDRTLREAVLVPPSLIKHYANPHLEAIWKRMNEELKTAAQVVFIGYSFRGADIYVKNAMLQSLAINKNKLYRAEDGTKFSIKVIDTCDDTIAEYKRWFGSKVRGIRKTFTEYVDNDMGKE